MNLETYLPSNSGPDETGWLAAREFLAEVRMAANLAALDPIEGQEPIHPEVVRFWENEAKKIASQANSYPDAEELKE